MSKLLTKSELNKAYLDMFRGGLEPLAKVLGAQEEHFDELVKALANSAMIITSEQKIAHASMVMGEAPKPFINGKYPQRGDTVKIDLVNNTDESLAFIQENGRYTLWDEQRKRNT